MSKLKLNIDRSFFNEAYLPLLNNKHRFTVLYGGGGSGKSHFVAQKMIIKAFKYPNRKILVVRKVQATIRESIYALFIEQLSAMGILKLCKHTTSHMKIELPNGSQFIFTGLDDPEKIKSITGIDDIIIEEVTELASADELAQLNTRLRSKAENQQIHVMFNPVSKNNWVYNYWFQQNQPDTTILHTTYKDNKFLPQSYIDSLLAYEHSNPLFYKVYALGEFGSLGKRVFTQWKAEDFDVHELVKNNNHLKTCIGLDWGFTNDPTVIMFSLVDIEKKKLYICEETYQKGLTNDRIAEIIKQKGYQKQIIIADSAEPKSIEEVRKHGIPKIKGVKKGAGSINHGIQFMQQFEIIIHSSCTKTIQEFEDYSYAKNKATGEYINDKFTGADHCIDAIRYSLSDQRNKVVFLNKSIFGL